MYINIEITHFSATSHYPAHVDCDYFEIPYHGAEMIHRKLDLDTARKLQWELVLAGGKRSIRSNLFDACICGSEVAYYTRA